MKAKVNKALKPFIDAKQIHKLMPVQTGFGAVGLDYHLCVGGHYVAIETKAMPKYGNPELTPIQKSTKAHIEAAGGMVFEVWDDVTLDIAMQNIQWCIANALLKKRFDPSCLG